MSWYQSHTNTSLIFCYYADEKDWNYSKSNNLEIVMKKNGFSNTFKGPLLKNLQKILTLLINKKDPYE